MTAATSILAVVPEIVLESDGSGRARFVHDRAVPVLQLHGLAGQGADLQLLGDLQHAKRGLEGRLANVGKAAKPPDGAVARLEALLAGVNEAIDILRHPLVRSPNVTAMAAASHVSRAAARSAGEISLQHRPAAAYSFARELATARSPSDGINLLMWNAPTAALFLQDPSTDLPADCQRALRASAAMLSAHEPGSATPFYLMESLPNLEVQATELQAASAATLRDFLTWTQTRRGDRSVPPTDPRNGPHVGLS